MRLPGEANTFVAEGKGRHDVKEWVGQVQVACAERLEDHLTEIRVGLREVVKPAVREAPYSKLKILNLLDGEMKHAWRLSLTIVSPRPSCAET